MDDWRSFSFSFPLTFSFSFSFSEPECTCKCLEGLTSFDICRLNKGAFCFLGVLCCADMSTVGAVVMMAGAVGKDRVSD